MKERRGGGLGEKKKEKGKPSENETWQKPGVAICKAPQVGRKKCARRSSQKNKAITRRGDKGMQNER